jgi:hypothetical protein
VDKGVDMKDPRLLGQDAVKIATTAQLTQYEKEIARNFYDNAVLRQMFPTEVRNTPGARDIEWKQLIDVGKPSYSKHGDAEDVEGAAYTTLTNKYVVINKMYHLKYYEMQEAITSGFPIETESAAAIGKVIAEELDYGLFNGVDTPVTVTGIAEFTNAQDAGAPSAVWDVAGTFHNDMLTICNLLYAKGIEKDITMLCTPGIPKVMHQLLSDGTTTFDKVQRAFLADLGISRLFVSSHPFTQRTGPRTADKLTGVGGTADNQVWLFAPQAGIKIVLAHDLQTVARPAQDGDVYKNVRIKATIKYSDDSLIAYMDAIDNDT